MRRPLLAALLAAACGPTPPPAADVKAAPAPAEPARAEPARAEPARAEAPATPAAAAERKPEPPLTQEEIALIESDPATLTPELRRKRAFALRRKILQNPDSPAAKQLEDLRLAVERGEVQPSLPGAPAQDEGRTRTAPNFSAPTKSEPAPPQPEKTP